MIKSVECALVKTLISDWSAREKKEKRGTNGGFVVRPKMGRLSIRPEFTLLNAGIPHLMQTVREDLKLLICEGLQGLVRQGLKGTPIVGKQTDTELLRPCLRWFSIRPEQV